MNSKLWKKDSNAYINISGLGLVNGGRNTWYIIGLDLLPFEIADTFDGTKEQAMQYIEDIAPYIEAA